MKTASARLPVTADGAQSPVEIGRAPARLRAAPSARPEPVEAADGPGPGAPAKRRGRALLRASLMLGGIAIVVVGFTSWWLTGGRYISTDDAYLRTPKLMVSTDVSGIVAAVEVSEGQTVKKNDVLFLVDRRQFEIALASAKAQLANTHANLAAARADYSQLQSGIAAQQAQVALAQINNDRALGLARSNAGTTAAYDQARLTLEGATSQLAALRKQAEAALTRLGGDLSAPIEAHPQHQIAQAAVDEAQRQLDHTVVRAPFDGVVTAVDKLQPGTFLVSQTAALTNTGALALVATSGAYVEANVKETDLAFVKVGDPVGFEIDAYPGRQWTGHVEAIAPASGSEFSVIPAQNASGNWVKVVQRVPLRLAVEQDADGPRLRAGMSVVANIDTGHMRRLADLVPSWIPGWMVPHGIRP